MCTLDGKPFYVEQFISQVDNQLHVVIVPVLFHWSIFSTLLGACSCMVYFETRALWLVSSRSNVIWC